MVRILNYVRLVEISYTLQGGWLGRGALVLPVELLLLVERDLGDAGADGWGVRRREAHALGVPAGQAWNAPELAAALCRRWEILAPRIEDVFDQPASGLLGLGGLGRRGLLLAVDGLRGSGAKNGRRDGLVASGWEILDGGGAWRKWLWLVLLVVGVLLVLLELVLLLELLLVVLLELLLEQQLLLG